MSFFSGQAFIQHRKPSCQGYTVLIEDSNIKLFMLGLYPIRCHACRELLPQKNGIKEDA